MQKGLEGEVTDFLGRDHYEPKSEKEGQREGYRNGYYPRTAKTAEGRLNLKIPRVRGTLQPYNSELLNRLSELEEGLYRLSTEMYVRGLSTRDIESTFTDNDGNALLSRSSVSQMTESLYAEYENFRNRDLSGYDVVYLSVDGVYESVRKYSKNQTILAAWAICSDGQKILLHLATAGQESESSWGDFFEEMIGRGLRQPLMVTSDGQKGVINAIIKYFPLARRQRCLVHKTRNLLNKTPLDAQKEVKASLHSVYYASDRTAADTLAAMFIDRYADLYPEMVRCFQDDLDACLAHLEFPGGHRRFIRTTNLIERSFAEEKRRTKVIPSHVNEKSAMKLVFGVLIRASYSWRKIKMNVLELALLRNIRKIIVKDNNDDDSTISYNLAA